MNRTGGSQHNVQEAGLVYLERLRTLQTSVLNAPASYTASAGDIVDALKQLAELVIWGDVNNYDAIFDYFCEENLMEFLTSVLPNSPFKVVRIQLLQTISMMIHNVENERSLYYLLSNNYINTLITTPNLYGGGDVSSWAASLLKTLSGLLNSTTIKFFYQEGNETFPLLEESLKFLSSSDSMKCTHVMTIILNIMRINEPSVTRYILDRSHILAQLALYLRSCWRRLNRQIKRSTLSSIGHTETILLTTCDDVFQFLQDVMDLANAEINKVLLERLFITCFFPLVGTLLRVMEHDVSLIESLQVPGDPSCSFYRETYQKLLVSNGLVGVYANNKSEIYAGNNVETSWVTREEQSVSQPARSEVIRDAGSTTTSPISSPRSKVQYLEMNISATLLTNELLPNVAYYLIVNHLAAARRDDIRHYLLLLTQCPFAPRYVLERVIPFNSAVQSAGDPSSTPRDTVAESDKCEVHIFDYMKSWERLVFGRKSFQGEVLKADEKDVQSDYVLNVLMGEFVRVAVCELPHSDNRLAMLMALLHSLQNTFIKRVPTDEEIEDYPFEAFVAVPSTRSGLHIVLQLLNSLARYLDTPRLRIQVLNLALSIARNNTDIVQKYNLKELPSFIEELRFHLEAGFNSVKLLLTAELEKCTSGHICAFYNEWISFENGPSRRVDILDYPQMLLDASQEVMMVVVEEEKKKQESKLGSTSNKRLSGGGGDGDDSNTSMVDPVQSELLEPNVVKPNTSEPPVIETSAKGKDVSGGVAQDATQSTRSRLSTWLFGSAYRQGLIASYFNTTSSNKHSISNARQSSNYNHHPWRVAQDPISIFRRHTQVSLLIREINNELVAGTVMTAREMKPSTTPAYDRCPLFKDQVVSMNGTILTLGGLVSLDNVHKYPCTLAMDGGVKRRYVVCNNMFFLLVREKTQSPLFEITCIHPLWNVELKRVDTPNRTCVMTVTWHPDAKRSVDISFSYSQPTRGYSVTDIELILDEEEDMVEYVQRFKIASAERINISSGILRDYFLRLQ